MTHLAGTECICCTLFIHSFIQLIVLVCLFVETAFQPCSLGWSQAGHLFWALSAARGASGARPYLNVSCIHSVRLGLVGQTQRQQIHP